MSILAVRTRVIQSFIYRGVDHSTEPSEETVGFLVRSENKTISLT